MSEGFANPIIGGGGGLVYPSIHSPNFSAGPPITGWSIDKDGDAFFGNLTLAGTFEGTDFIIGPAGFFLYTPAPAAGALTESGAAKAGTDSEGNAYVSGWAVYGSNGQIIAMQVTSGAATLTWFSGAASEALAANISTVVFARGGAAEQIATFISGPETTASPEDEASIALYSSPANAAGEATGYMQYSQAAGSPPALVQSAVGESSNSTTTTVTLTTAATLGNCLIVTAQCDSSSGPDPTITGITIGGSADNFASVKVVAGSITRVEIWADPNIGTSSKTIVVTTSAATGALVNVTVLEYSGLATASPADQVSGKATTAAGTGWTSDTTPGQTASGDIAVGIVAAEQAGGTINGPASPWTNLAQISSGRTITMTGYQSLGSSLAGVAYAGTFATSPGGYSAAVATFKAAAGSSGSRLLVAQWSKAGFGGLLVSKNVSAVPGSSPAVAETWHNLGLNAGFAATAGFHTPRYQYEAVNGGRVRLSGVVSLTANKSTGAVAATLPAGYRPTAKVDLTGSNSLSGASDAALQILTTGDITLGGAGTSGNFFSLDGLTFELD